MNKYLIVTFSDGSRWKISAKHIAHLRADYYVTVDVMAGDRTYEELYPAEYEYSLGDDSELLDWANNNMNWIDAVTVAVQIRVDPKTPNYTKEWTNADKEIIDESG